MASSSLSDHLVRIDEDSHLSCLPGFHGVIKASPEDFVVREIDWTGAVAQDDSEPPPSPPALHKRQRVAKAAARSVATFTERVADDSRPLDALLNVDAVSAFASRVEHDTGCTDYTEIDVQPCDKVKRAQLYAELQARFPFLRLLPKRQAAPAAAAVGEEAVCLRVERNNKFDTLLPLLGVDQVRKLQRFVNRAPAENPVSGCLVLSGGMTKEQRAAIHRAIAARLPMLRTTTSREGAVVVSFKPRKHKRARSANDDDAADDGAGAAAGASGAAAPAPGHAWFLLRKCGTEQMAAVVQIARAMGVSPNSIALCGTKDKRAITYQWCSLPRVAATDVQRLNDRFGAHLRVLACAERSVSCRLGCLKGNRFQVVLRHVAAPRSTVLSAVQRVAERGFINFFGPQRVGYQCHAVRPWEIGRAMLQQDWAAAMRLLLAPLGSPTAAAASSTAVVSSAAASLTAASAQDDEAAAADTQGGDDEDADDDPDLSCDADAAKRYYQATGDVDGTLQRIGLRCVREAALLKGMRRFGSSDPLQCLRQIPFLALSAYPRAYQSWVWNRMAALRVQRLGDEPVEGDLVAVPSAARRGLHTVDATEAVDATDGDAVHVVTAADVEARRYRITDVVLPLPGHAVRLPETCIAEEYRAVLASDGLDMAAMRQSHGFNNLPGAYRALVVKPTEVRAWHEGTQLVGDAGSAACGDAGSAACGDAETVTLEFSLPEGCFATMCLREMMQL